MRVILFHGCRMHTRTFVPSNRISDVANANCTTSPRATFVFRTERLSTFVTTQSLRGQATRFLRNFNGPFIFIGHPHHSKDLLTLRNVTTGDTLPRAVNIERVVVVPDSASRDLQLPVDAVLPPDPQDPPVGYPCHPSRQILTSLPSSMHLVNTCMRSQIFRRLASM